MTALVIDWLRGKGFKPVEVEVPVCSYVEPRFPDSEGVDHLTRTRTWRADVAGAIIPTDTEMRLLNVPGLSESVADRGYLTAVVEVKVSRSDFRKDFGYKWPPAECQFTNPANLLIVAYPSGLIHQEELPAGWFGLERIGKSDRFKFHRVGELQETDTAQREAFLLQLGMKCDHRTSRVFAKTINEGLRKWRAKDNPLTLLKCLRLLRAAMSLDTVEEVAEYVNYRIGYSAGSSSVPRMLHKFACELRERGTVVTEEQLIRLPAWRRGGIG